MSLSITPSADGNTAELRLGGVVLATFSNSGVENGVLTADAATAQGLTNVKKLLTPGGLTSAFGGSNQSLTASGYQKLPGGLILQWSSLNSAASATTSGTWPITFPNGPLFVTGGEITEATGGYYFLQIISSSASGFSGVVYGANPATAPAAAGSFPIKVFALGY
jgi:hypothetical protein